MTQSDKAPTAKVYVFKAKPADDEYDDRLWTVGVIGWADIMIVHHEAATFEEAWEWLYKNYKRETP